MEIYDTSIVLVLGMHRSGTSCLAGALERCGVNFSDIPRKSKYNKKGNFERKEIYDLNDQILALNKASWYSPPQHEIVFHNYHETKVEEIIEKLRKIKKIGIKDPRILLMLEAWRKCLGGNCQMIGSFRHPVAVALSLRQRNNFTIEKSLQLWKDYNDRLISVHKENPFPLIEYNLTNRALYVECVIRLAKMLNTSPSKFRLNWFVSDKLSHYSSKTASVPPFCRDSYDYLLNNSICNQ